MAYNTGNAIGSNDPRDLFDNAGNLDRLSNGPAVSYPDRLGAARKSWAGMEADFQAFLLASGYQDIGTYPSIPPITARNQIFLKDGEYYRAAAATVLPYTVTGTWATDSPDFVSVGDATLRQDITGGSFLESSWSMHRGSSVGAILDSIGGLPVLAEYDGSDETAALQTAIDTAVGIGSRYVRVDGPLYAPGALTDRGNVIFVGKGSLRGVHRRRVYPERSHSMHFPGINPPRHLKQLRATDAPTVAFMGDSLLTYTADSIGRTVTLASLLEHKMRMDNPGKTFAFHNRAIGGETWTTANGVAATTSYPWYTNPTTPWLDYVEALNPDVVILSFGMNDAQSFSRAHFESVIGKILAWAKVPDIILCTNMVPSMELHATFGEYGTVAGQEGRDFAAGYVRQYAIRNGYGLIDVNRVFNLVRDGRDVRSQRLRRIATDQAVGSGAYEAADPCHGFYIAGTITGTAEEIASKFDGANGPVAVRIGRNFNDVAFIVNDPLNPGYFGLTLYNDGANIYQGIGSTVQIPTTPFTLIFEKLDNQLLIRLAEDTSTADLFRVDMLENHGGEFNPAIGYYNTSFATGPFSQITYSAGESELYMPTLLNDEIWGHGAATAVTQLPYGGNGVNHPTSIGAMAIYGPAVAAADFRAEPPEVLYSGSASLSSLPTYADNAAALAGGLTAGKLYKTATGELRIVY